MNIYAGCVQDSTFLPSSTFKILSPILRNTSKWLLLSNLHLVYFMLIQHFIASSLFQLLMTSSKFTEDFPGSSKVYYPLSGRNDFTVLLGICGGPAKLYQ